MIPEQMHNMHHLSNLLLLLLLAVFEVGCCAQSMQNYVDDDTGEVKSFNPNDQIQVQVKNLSQYRVDVYWDDGKYGKNIATLEASGGTSKLNTFQGHSFFVTRHGVREALFDPKMDEQHRFYIEKPNQHLVVPEDAAPSKSKCQDRFSICEKEAARGSCRTAPGWMIVHCCRSCDEELGASRLIDAKVRCTRENLSMTGPAWQPGDLHKLFVSWATDDNFDKYAPMVHSSPGGEFGGSVGPWVLSFDNFMTSDEADAIWKGGEISGFERSTDQGKTNDAGEMEKVISKTRTSSNAWCNKKCESLPGVRSVTGKIEDVTGIPRVNYESFQILEYQKDQFYRRHHDSSSGKDSTPAGHRILTFFLYLSDVEEGGETSFSKLGLDIKPKKGRALVWPSVQNDNPNEWDDRMFHEAKDVIKGEKRAANHWIHLYDYETPNLWGCTGSFS